MKHIFEIQLSVANYATEQKSFLKSLPHRFEKDHNRAARVKNAEGFQMVPLLECMTVRLVPRKISQILGPDRKLYVTFRLWYETNSEQNMAVHQLKRNMLDLRQDLTVDVNPVQSYKDLHFANAFINIYSELVQWLESKIDPLAKKMGLQSSPNVTAKAPLIYSL